MDNLQAGLQQWGYDQAGSKHGHQGSWFNMPEGGITEMVSSIWNPPSVSANQEAEYGTNNARAAQPYAYQNVPLPQNTLPAAYQAPTGNEGDVGGGDVGGGNQGSSFEEQLNSFYNEAMSNSRSNESQAKSELGDIASSQIAGLEGELAGRLPEYEKSRGNTAKRGAKSLAELAEDLRGSSRNIGNFLGAKGSYSPSANNNVSYALSKEFGKNRADVRSQVSDELSRIDTAEQELKTEVSGRINEVNTWKATQIAKISQAYSSFRDNLDYGKANQMLDYLKQIEGEARSLTTNLVTGAQSRLAELNNVKIKLSNTGNFNPQDIVRNEYKFNPGNSNIDDIVNYIYGRRKDTQV